MREVNKGEERGQVPESFIILASSTTKKENRDFSEETIRGQYSAFLKL